MAGQIVRVGKVAVGAEKLVLIAGPCAVESRDIVMRTAEAVREAGRNFNIPVIFKSSYKKGNRLSGESFSSIGIDKALAILSEVRDQFDLPILTDVHNEDEIKMTSEVADCLQIPAFLCRQTDLVVAAARTMRPVNIKKGQFLSPEDMKPITDKVLSTGNPLVLITERGTSFGYRDLVVDFRGLVVMRQFGHPLVFDCTHSVQKPGAGGQNSGGDPRFILPLARAAVAVGVDALFVETHPDPAQALSDRECQLPIDQLPHFVEEIRKIRPS